MVVRRTSGPLLVNAPGYEHVETVPALLDEESFQTLIAIERKRTDRSGRPFLLILLDAGDSLPVRKGETALSNIASELCATIRDAGVAGWYRKRRVVGIMLPEIPPEDKRQIVTSTLSDVVATLSDALTMEEFSQLHISTHLYPEDWQHELCRRPSNPALYPDLRSRDQSRKLQSIIKRAMDLVGSMAALVIFAPLFGLIAIAIKLSSAGPVFFRQERVGEHGRPFIFLKFRSMRVNNDVGVHQQWFKDYLSGRTTQRITNGTTVVKMTNDPRVTRVGRFLRRTSLDELPQFLNVLRGEMSLVGPRPPIPYEVDAYQSWHRGRVLEAKPGITGLWQVTGRGRVSFDQMVRLDLQYARTWSLWLDIKILLKTPRAVLFGEGAY
jgi:exopolysaccharide biosynthesis polyprenyl glycosylphosphotransferase